MDPEAQTPKLVIIKNIRLETIVVRKTLLKLILFKQGKKVDLGKKSMMQKAVFKKS